MRGDTVRLKGEGGGAGLGAGVEKVGKAARGVEGDSEVAGERWTKSSRPCVRVDLRWKHVRPESVA